MADLANGTLMETMMTVDLIADVMRAAEPKAMRQAALELGQRTALARSDRSVFESVRSAVATAKLGSQPGTPDLLVGVMAAADPLQLTQVIARLEGIGDKSSDTAVRQVAAATPQSSPATADEGLYGADLASGELISPDQIGPDQIGPDLIGPDLIGQDPISKQLASQGAWPYFRSSRITAFAS